MTNARDGTALTGVTGLREHDTANYGTELVYRGNVTRSVSFANTRNMAYDITGRVISTDDNRQAGNNDAAVTAITANGLTSTFSYNNSLGPTGSQGPNTATGGDRLR